MNRKYYQHVFKLLVNGATGIAVGMATNIHRCMTYMEVISALHLLMKNPLTTTELMEALPGPDFPTGGLVLGKFNWVAMKLDADRLLLRGRVQIEVEKRKRTHHH